MFLPINQLMDPLNSSNQPQSYEESYVSYGNNYRKCKHCQDNVVEEKIFSTHNIPSHVSDKSEA